MENYDDILANLEKKVNEISPTSETTIAPKSGFGRFFTRFINWSYIPYYVLVLIPIILIIAFSVSKPDYLTKKNKEGEKILDVKRMLILVFIITTLFVVGYVIYRYKFN